MEAVDLVQEQLSHFLSSKWMKQWQEMSKFAKLIHNDQNTVS